MRICNYCGSEIDDKTLYASSPPKYKCPKCGFIPISQTRIVKKDMSCKEAGRRGGIKTSLRHGEDFYRKIGRKGGLRTQQLLQAGKADEKEEKREKYLEEMRKKLTLYPIGDDGKWFLIDKENE
jgi:general stress protein YciG